MFQFFLSHGLKIYMIYTKSDPALRADVDRTTDLGLNREFGIFSTC